MVELGAGIGLVSLVARTVGAKVVVATERPIALPLLNMNVIESGLTNVTARTLDWTAGITGVENLHHGRTFDVVLGSDLVFGR